ncbi:conserved hypothetical protein [Cyanobium sp. PCC 7001]|uniref:hypothetical protein n=1 Tax=Cyanobium sp. PCC 7001 TaxID=180281 RepID=UPI0001805BBC|nr:hypothetical protein [Cyanobium sp. PCC 7001]EDY37465.1 conserved hypothetical protein [Cyanobium sp. PCC 7001]
MPQSRSGRSSRGHSSRAAQRATAFVTVAVAGLLCYAMFVQIAAEQNLSPYPTALFVAMAAVVGSVLNQPFREDPLASDGGSPWLYLVWKASVAVAFACLLYLMFMGQVLTGGIFPKFCGDTAGFTDVRGFVADVHPASNADFAKLLVWAFVAGFSEKFVPNLITQITGSGRPGSGTGDAMGGTSGRAGERPGLDPGQDSGGPDGDP